MKDCLILKFEDIAWVYTHYVYGLPYIDCLLSKFIVKI